IAINTTPGKNEETLSRLEGHILSYQDLFELSLAIGSSIDLQENMDHFLHSLLDKKKFDSASLWVFNPNFCLGIQRLHDYSIKSQEGISLSEKNAYFSNICRHNLHPLIQEIDFYPVKAGETGEGSLAILPLKDKGYLRLYSSQRNTPFVDQEAEQLIPLLDHFCTSLNSSLSLESYKKELQAKKLKNTQLQTTIDSALDGFITINSQGEICNWNPRTEEIFGWKRSEVIGKRIDKVIVALDYLDIHKHALYAQIIPDGSDFIKRRLEMVSKRKSGEVITIELSLFSVPDKKKPLNCAYIRDISLSKEKEAEQKALLKELHSSNQDLKDFAHMVSHDLKAPLRGIHNLADWLSADYEDKLGEEGNQLLGLMKSRVLRMQELINGILEYARVGKEKGEDKLVELRPAIHEIVELLAPPAHINIRICEHLPNILINEVGIRQVFQNLISNSIKYMDKDQGKIEVGCRKEKGRIVFWVKDNGKGIARKDFKKVFDMFETLDQKKSYDSTGVGLAIVKKIISNMQGKIWLESEEGEGSCFYICFPKKICVKKERKIPVLIN
ncbi:MAG: PAS domain-containing sensor histidine kinase, partial [Bacteroidota bacterium]